MTLYYFRPKSYKKLKTCFSYSLSPKHFSSEQIYLIEMFCLMFIKCPWDSRSRADFCDSGGIWSWKCQNKLVSICRTVRITSLFGAENLLNIILGFSSNFDKVFRRRGGGGRTKEIWLMQFWGLHDWVYYLILGVCNSL